jgi:hypothetical protein
VSALSFSGGSVTYIHTYTHTYIHTYMHAYMHAYIWYIYHISICIHTQTHTHTHTLYDTHSLTTYVTHSSLSGASVQLFGAMGSLVAQSKPFLSSSEFDGELTQKLLPPLHPEHLSKTALRSSLHMPLHGVSHWSWHTLAQ